MDTTTNIILLRNTGHGTAEIIFPDGTAYTEGLIDGIADNTRYPLSVIGQMVSDVRLAADTGIYTIEIPMGHEVSDPATARLNSGTAFAVCMADYVSFDGTSSVGQVWLRRFVHETEAHPVVALAFDDDGILYYRLEVLLPAAAHHLDAYLEEILHHLGACDGVTSITFPDRPELDMS